MVERLVIAAVLIAAISVAAIVVERRRRPQPTPSGPNPGLPPALDRADFAGRDKPWLVVMFSSHNCDSCVVMRDKVAVLESDDVAVDIVEFSQRKAIHERYGVDSVPLIVIADSDGEIGAGFLGKVSATDLWAKVAEVRDPESGTSVGTQCGADHHLDHQHLDHQPRNEG